MKNLLSFFIFATLIFLLTSCSKDEQYSCDPEINKWVGNNLETIHTMTRSNWVDIGDVSYKRGAYSAFYVEQKVALWVDKFNEILSYDWTEAEYEHISSLREVIQNNIVWFNQDCPEEDRNNKDLFMYKWLDYATTQLNWSNELIYSIAFTAESLNKNKTLVKSKNTISPLIASRSESGGEMLCDCNNPESAHYFACPNDGSYDCIKGGCKETSSSCGWMWLDPCNGLCYKKS